MSRTVEELRTELALWEEARANAAAAMAGGDNTNVPGGKPNSSGGSSVDHMSALREIRATIEHLRRQIAIAEGGFTNLTQVDC